MDSLDQLSILEATLADDITDFLEENQVDDDDSYSVSDVEALITKSEENRSSYRKMHKELLALLGDKYAEKYGAKYDQLIASMKEYIMDSKKVCKMMKRTEKTEKSKESDGDVQSFEFLYDDVSRSLGEVEKRLAISCEDLTDAEVIQKKEDLSEITEALSEVTKKFPELFQLKSRVRSGGDVRKLKDEYEKVMSMKNEFAESLKTEFREREFEKEDRFKESKLNIKLAKFKGYSSSTDIYTFKDEFEKLHLRGTPRRLLPELLKNNFLEDSALCLVKSVDDIDEIWERLKSAYGDPKMMLDLKFSEVGKIDVFWKCRDPEKIVVGLTKIINLMKDLKKISEDHSIQSKLYHGDGLQRIMRILGSNRVDRWLSQTCDQELDDENSWIHLIVFLEKEVKVQQRKLLVLGKGEGTKEKPSSGIDKKCDEKGQRKFSHHTEDKMCNRDNYSGNKETLLCSICGEEGHVATMGPGYTKLIQYFTCKRFVNMTPTERFIELKKKGLCFQCLFPGAQAGKGKHKEGKCQRDFTCQHNDHQRYRLKKHVLVCEEHKDNPENKKLLDEYKRRCILKEKNVDLPSFSKELSFHADNMDSKRYADVHTSSDDVMHKAIYQLQVIEVDNNRYSVFYDNGCGDFVSRRQAVDRLGNRAQQEYGGPIKIGGVGGITTVSPHGIYTVSLPLSSGVDAYFSGICLDQITAQFPEYPLQGRVEDDLRNAYRESSGDPDTLPKLPRCVGGEIDLMIGIKYLRYHPEKIFQLPSGLAIYKSVFRNADGGDGVIGGPHEVFTAIENHYNLDHNHNMTFFCNQRQLYRMGYQINPDVSLLGFKNPSKDETNERDCSSPSFATGCRKMSASDLLGSEITYRCVKCRSCKDCKDGEQIESISIREEVEDDLIKRSINVNPADRVCTAALPFIHNPVTTLAPNMHKAIKVYNQQVKKLSKHPDDKNAVLESERKLQSLGYVDYVQNLSQDQQEALQNHPVKNFISWRTVWKSSSITTPCRVVFDASQCTDSGFSLNDILAKGKNHMNKLQEIFIRWSMHEFAFHTDVQKMYNCVQLQESDWCYQRYLWQENLDPAEKPHEKVIKTLIYGVKPSGNLAEYCIRETAKLSSKEYPEIDEIVSKDIYVDDCLSGEKTEELVALRADQLEIVLNKGGFTLKGIAISGRDPPQNLSEDGTSIAVAGVRWFPKDDLISLNASELNFAKKQRGRKPTQNHTNEIPEKLTRRHCASKYAELFDITGMLTPITCAMKLDLHDLVKCGLSWDDAIPDSLRPLWESHFQMMQELRNIKYRRAIIPSDAVDLAINTIDCGDASMLLACTAIYVRFKRRNGLYSCQMVLSRARLIPEGTSQPRAELYAAMLNAHSGEVVRRSFYKHHNSHVKLTDSQIVLHWISNENRPLKQWVRNRVVEIRRFTNTSDWNYVDSANMIADKGTRRGCTLEDINPDSTWRSGIDWMKREITDFPMKSVNEVSLNNDEIQELNKEVPILNDYLKKKNAPDVSGDVNCVAAIPDVSEDANCVAVSRSIPDEVRKRYEFSNYIIDPNKYNYSKILRITAYVIKFSSILLQRLRSARSDVVNVRSVESETPTSLFLSETDINKAENYFFQLASKEVKYFMTKNQYQNISSERNGILFYTGRILPSEEITFVSPMTDVMRDLSSITFCVPLIDRYSPIAYSIVNNIHWYDKVVKHSGIETMWRFVLKYAFIIEGRDIVKRIKRGCQRCRYLAKRTIEVSMGPVSRYNLTVAPAFYITQMDIAGPFKAFSYHNRRSTIKIWIIVFCCVVTSTVSIKVMEDYSSTSFIQSFVRFSCEMGYPKILLADSGSQLIKACDDIKMKFQDIKFKLQKDASVELEVCPVGGHHMNGKVERKILEIKKSVEKSVSNERLSVLQWETVMTEIANSINDLPLALGNTVGDFECMDLITPNRLRLGRNNNRSPVGHLTVTSDAAKILELNERIFNTWFENWLLVHVPKLIPVPKWFKNDRDLKPGDIVLFLKNDKVLSSTYQYGVVEAIELSKDGKARKARVRYRNSHEDVNRETYRSVRKLVMIHPVDELNIVQELGEIASSFDLKKTMNNNENEE